MAKQLFTEIAATSLYLIPTWIKRFEIETILSCNPRFQHECTTLYPSDKITDEDTMLRKLIQGTMFNPYQITIVTEDKLIRTESLETVKKELIRIYDNGTENEENPMSSARFLKLNMKPPKPTPWLSMLKQRCPPPYEGNRSALGRCRHPAPTEELWQTQNDDHCSNITNGTTSPPTTIANQTPNPQFCKGLSSDNECDGPRVPYLDPDQQLAKENAVAFQSSEQKAKIDSCETPPLWHVNFVRQTQGLSRLHDISAEYYDSWKDNNIKQATTRAKADREAERDKSQPRRKPVSTDKIDADSNCYSVPPRARAALRVAGITSRFTGKPPELTPPPSSTSSTSSPATIDPTTDSTSGSIRIFVRGTTDKTTTHVVQSTDTVKSLQRTLHNKLGIPASTLLNVLCTLDKNFSVLTHSTTTALAQIRQSPCYSASAVGATRKTTATTETCS
jgi:hypothetical protein